MAEEKKEVGHHLVNYPYPTFDLATDAGRMLFRILTGAEQTDLDCKIHCGYVVMGFGLSMVPHDHAEAAAAGEPDEEELKKHLAVFDQESAALDQEAIPWVQIVTFLAPLLLKWWQNR